MPESLSSLSHLSQRNLAAKQLWPSPLLWLAAPPGIPAPSQPPPSLSVILDPKRRWPTENPRSSGNVGMLRCADRTQELPRLAQRCCLHPKTEETLMAPGHVCQLLLGSGGAHSVSPELRGWPRTRAERLHVGLFVLPCVMQEGGPSAPPGEVCLSRPTCRPLSPGTVQVWPVGEQSLWCPQERS